MPDEGRRGWEDTTELIHLTGSHCQWQPETVHYWQSKSDTSAFGPFPPSTVLGVKIRVCRGFDGVCVPVLFGSGMTDLLPGQRVFVQAESVPRGLQATRVEPL